MPASVGASKSDKCGKIQSNARADWAETRELFLGQIASMLPAIYSGLKFVLAHREDQDMKRSRLFEEQNLGTLKEREAGVSVADLCRKHRVSAASIYNWKAASAEWPSRRRAA